VTHSEFVSACAEGRIRVEVDGTAAARFLSGRLLLPLAFMPVVGAGVALALVGWVWSGLALIGLGILVPRLVRRGAARFVLHQALEDAEFYEEALREGLLRLGPAAERQP
jgi:hypothetical protein